MSCPALQTHNHRENGARIVFAQVGMGPHRCLRMNSQWQKCRGSGTKRRCNCFYVKFQHNKYTPCSYSPPATARLSLIDPLKQYGYYWRPKDGAGTTIFVNCLLPRTTPMPAEPPCLSLPRG